MAKTQLGKIKSSHVSSLYTKSAEIHKLSKQSKKLKALLQKTTDQEEVKKLEKELKGIKERLDHKKKYWKTSSKVASSKKHGSVVSIPVEDYLMENSNSLTEETGAIQKSDSNEVETCEGAANNIASPTILPQDVDVLVQSMDSAELFDLWEKRADRIVDRMSAAKVFAIVRFMRGIDSEQKSYRDYLDHELVLGFPEYESVSIAPPPSGMHHEKRKALVSQTLRDGQGSFRAKLLKHYGCRCMVTGETIDSIIEAAHIIPYCGEDSNHIQNGLLLRVDVHRLFDKNLLSFAPRTATICVSPKLKNSSYWPLHGKKLIVKAKLLVNVGYLDERWNEFRLVNKVD